MLYIVSYINNDGARIREEFNTIEEAHYFYECAYQYEVESLTITENKTDEE